MIIIFNISIHMVYTVLVDWLKLWSAYPATVATPKDSKNKLIMTAYRATLLSLLSSPDLKGLRLRHLKENLN